MRTTVLRDHIFRAAHLNGLLGAHTGNYVVVTPSIVQRAAGANMSVDVGAFTYVLGGVFGAKTSTTNVVVEASDANPRIDLLYLATSGTLTVMKGTARAIVPTGETTWQKWEEPYPPDFSATDGILLAEIEVPGSATSILDANIRNIAVPALPVKIDSMASVEVFQRGTEVIARKADGTILDSGVVGTDDTDVINAAVTGCPTNGSILIGPGTYTLEASGGPFYLSGDGTTNPFYYCIGVLEAKNVHLFGAGPGITTLKLAASQHYTDHMVAMILNRTTGDSSNGHTGFTVANMTIDGNKANQSVIYHDGAGCILTGSIRSNESYWNLEIKDSFGYSIYVGNNGNGPANFVRMNNIYIHGSYKSGITTDTATDLAISNCVIYDSSTGLEILGNTDYATRTYDDIAISNVVCRKAGITIWCINGLVMTGCNMDITGATSCGLQIHCSYNVDVIGCRFTGNKTSQYVSYIDGGQYVADGAYKNVNLHDCIFDGYIAFKVFGSAKIQAYNCIFHAYTDDTNYGACVHLKEMSETVTCEVKLYDCELIAEAATTKLIEAVASTVLWLYRCHAPRLGVIDTAGSLRTQECYGAGLEGYNSRWRQETSDAYNSTPASTYTITMTADRSAVVPVGTPVKVICATSGTCYGIVTAITSNLMTLACMPMTGAISYLAYGPADLVGQVDYIIPGSYADGANSTLIATDQKSYSFWRGRPARLVQISHKHYSNDSTSNPYVTAMINGNVVGTDNTNTGLQVTTSTASTTSGINASNNRILNGQAIELKTTAGGTGNASFLTVMLTFVSED